ncbi:hypothetical protein [[Phormidium] sp. ETS-05]|uniref:hypothetical protein n=1 Tax=[Phormidium] sp. ETS-05 TaxID=222819 RepID=UPI0018EF22D7|nr:hypothetical protein [[Phormidium] sp. ETS-05]
MKSPLTVPGIAQKWVSLGDLVAAIAVPDLLPLPADVRFAYCKRTNQSHCNYSKEVLSDGRK